MMFLAVIVIGYLIYTQMNQQKHTNQSIQPPNNTKSPRDMLDLRLAKGELSVEEYKEIKQQL